jgi:hypothetical protein
MNVLNRRGFSIVEAMMGITVLMIGIVPVMSFLVSTNRGYTRVDGEVSAAMAGFELLTTIRGERWDENSTPAGNAGRVISYLAAGSRSDIGPDVGETTIDTFDDVDDYNEYTDKFGSRYTRTVLVKYINADFDGGTNAYTFSDAAKSDYKLIRVTVTWTGAKGPTSETMETICVNGVAI